MSPDGAGNIWANMARNWAILGLGKIGQYWAIFTTLQKLCWHFQTFEYTKMSPDGAEKIKAALGKLGQESGQF